MGCAYVMLSTMTFNSSKSHMCLCKSILHLKNWSLPWRAVGFLNEAKVFCLLNLLKDLTFDNCFSVTVEEHHDCFFLVDAHALGGGKEAEGIELSLQ